MRYMQFHCEGVVDCLCCKVVTNLVSYYEFGEVAHIFMLEDETTKNIA